MKVCLVGAEFEENLALRYLWGALERAGHAVRMIPFNDPAELDRAARELAGSSAPLAGFSMVFTRRAREFAALAVRARELGYGGHLTVGGHFAAFHAEALLAEIPAFDSVVIGEGEGPLCRLAGKLDDLGQVEGLVWRDGWTVRRNAPATKPPDLDALAWPVRKRPFDRFLRLPIVNLLASRGCTHSCAFCSISAWHRFCGGERHRLRAPAAVASEMAELYRQGVRIFNFHDDDFLPSRRAAAFDRARVLQRELAARDVGRIAFAIKARADVVDEELFALLRTMGLFRVFLGIEAGTDEALGRLGRGQSRADNVRALAIVNRLELHACFNLLLFNPESTLEDVAENVAFLAAHPANPMNFCRTEVYAGTPLERRLQAAGRLRGSFWGWDYAIAEPRAQAAFEVAYAAFRERNWGDPGLHHRTMGVDYESQLLARFFGIDRGLRRRVQVFVVEVNRNTCAGLEEVLRFVEAGVPTPAARRAFVEDLSVRLRADERRLLAESDRLLAEIRGAASSNRTDRSTRTGRMLRGAAAVAGIAAAAIGVACKRADGTGKDAQVEPAPQAEAEPTWCCEEAPTIPQQDAGTFATPGVESPDAESSGAVPAEIGSPDVGPSDVGPSDGGDEDESQTHVREMAAQASLPDGLSESLQRILGGADAFEDDAERARADGRSRTGPPPMTHENEVAAMPLDLGEPQPHVRMSGPVLVEGGGVNRNAYTTAVGRRMGGIVARYRQSVSSNPGLSGQATFLIHVGSDGAVRVEVESSDAGLQESGLVDYVTLQLRALDFSGSPPPNGEVVIRQTFTFELPSSG